MMAYIASSNANGCNETGSAFGMISYQKASAMTDFDRALIDRLYPLRRALAQIVATLEPRQAQAPGR